MKLIPHHQHDAMITNTAQHQSVLTVASLLVTVEEVISFLVGRPLVV